MIRRVFLLAAAAIALLSGAPPAVAADAPMIAAAKAGDAAMMAKLLKRGESPDAADENGLSALNWAAYNGRMAVVRQLVQRGARVDFVGAKDGWTPLMNAAARGRADVAVYLIAHGADVNARSAIGSFTPLMYAARKSHLDIVKALIERGAAVSAVSDDDRTPLMFADTQPDESIGAYIERHGGVRTPAGAPR